MKRGVFIGFFQDQGSDVRHLKSSFAQKLASALSERNIALDLVDETSTLTRQLSLPDGCRHLSMQTWLEQHTTPRLRSAFSGIGDLSSVWKTCQFEAGQLRDNRSSCINLMRSLRHNFRIVNALHTAQRARGLELVLVWNSHRAPNYLIGQVCRRIGVQWLCAEGGLVPGSVELDSRGNQWESLPQRRQEQFDTLPVTSKDRQVATDYLDFIRKNKLAKRRHVADNKNQQPSVTKGDLPVVLFAGMDEQSTGIGTPHSPFSTGWSPVYRDGLDCLEHLAELAHRHQWQVLNKPHPNMVGVEKTPALSNVRNVPPDVDFFAVLSQSDVVVTIGSSVAFHSVLHGVPTVLAGRNALAGHQICHEIDTRSRMEQTLINALRDPGVSSLPHLVTYTARCMKSTLFEYGEEYAEYGGQSIESCADQILHYTDSRQWLQDVFPTDKMTGGK